MQLMDRTWTGAWLPSYGVVDNDSEMYSAFATHGCRPPFRVWARSFIQLRQYRLSELEPEVMSAGVRRDMVTERVPSRKVEGVLSKEVWFARLGWIIDR